MEKLVSMIKQRVYFFSTPVIIGEPKEKYPDEILGDSRGKRADR